MARITKITALMLAGALSFSFVGCAKEDIDTLPGGLAPGTSSLQADRDKGANGDTMAGNTDTDEKIINEGQSGPGRPEVKPERSVELPASFPSELFVIDNRSIIFDAGERGFNAWFLILEAESPRDLRSAVDEIVSKNAFEILSFEETDSATATWILANEIFNADIYLMKDTSGKYLLNIELESIN